MCKATAQPTYEKVAAPRKSTHLLRYATGKDLALYGVALCTVIISGLNQPAQLIIFGNLLDSFNGSNKAQAVRLVHFFALMYALVGDQQLITITVQTALATRVAAAQARRCRERYFDAILSKPVAWFDTENAGAVGASVLEATLAIQDGLGEKFTTGLQGVLSFVFGIAVSLYYAWSLTLVTIGALPFIVALLSLAAKLQSRANERATSASSDASARAMEALVNVRTVAAFGAERREADAYDDACQKAAKASLSSAVATGGNAALVAGILYGTWALGLWYGSYLIRRDMKAHDECNYRVTEDGSLREPHEKCVSGGDVMTAFLCVLFGGLALLQALPGIAAFTLASAEAKRVYAVIDGAEEEDARDGPPVVVARPVGGAGAAISFENVTFAYPTRPDRPVYEGLTLDVEAGSTVAFGAFGLRKVDRGPTPVKVLRRVGRDGRRRRHQSPRRRGAAGARRVRRPGARAL